MESALKQPASHRFKSSEALKNILKQNRDLNKQYQDKLCSYTPSTSQESKYKKIRFDSSSPSMNKWFDQTANSSQLSIRPTNISSTKSRNKSVESTFHKTARIGRHSVIPKTNNLSIINQDIRCATPDYFRLALYTILKPQTNNMSTRKRRKSEK